MNAALTLFSTPAAQHLAWVLLHFLWQGAVIALVLALVLRLLARGSSHLRYAVILGALVACMAAPVATWIVVDSPPLFPSPNAVHFQASTGDRHPILSPSAPHQTVNSSLMHEPAPFDRVRAVLDQVSLLVVAAWLMGVLFLAVRFLLGWAALQRVRRSGIPLADREGQRRFAALLERMRIAVPVRLLESVRVEVPMLIGCFRPVILVPVSVLSGLTTDELEAVLAHELAHVRRCDYLVNVLQTGIEIVLFYHPAVWWISRRLREERENCCDDIALEIIQDRVTYAGALARLEESRDASPALAASGGLLLRRIRRIAGVETRSRPLMPLLLLLVIFACLATALAVTARPVPASLASAATKREPNPSPVWPPGAAAFGLWGEAVNLLEKSAENSAGKLRLQLEHLANGPTVYAQTCDEDHRQMSIFIDGDDPAATQPRLTFTYSEKLVGTSSVHLKGTVELKDRHGTVVDRATGEWTQRLDTQVRLTVHGGPTVLVPSTVSELSLPVGSEINVGYELYLTLRALALSPQDSPAKQPSGEPEDIELTRMVDDGPPVEPSDPVLTVRTFLAPPRFFPDPAAAPASTPSILGELHIDHAARDMKQDLASRGIHFPPGAIAVLLPDSNKLIVRDTPDQLDQLAKLIEQTHPAPPKITIIGRVVAQNPDQIDFAKSSGSLVYADGHAHDFQLSQDGSFEVSDLVPGTYNRSLNLVEKTKPGALPGLDQYVTLDPILLDGKLGPRQTMSLSIARPFGEALAKGMVRIALTVIEIDEDTYQANRALIDANVQRGDDALLLALHNLPGVDYVSLPEVTTLPGHQADIDLVREFSYPVAYDWPSVALMKVKGATLTRPVPATPREFVTKPIGIESEITPTLDDGKIMLSGQYQVTDFEGFTESNVSGVMAPSFETKESHFFEALNYGQRKAVWIPGSYVEAGRPIPSIARDGTTKVALSTPSSSTSIIKKRRLLLLGADLIH